MLKKLSQLAIYLDEGVDALSVRAAQLYFGRLCRDKYSVSTISSNEILQKKLRSQVFVMPGGADLPYLKRLSGPGNVLIKNFVEGGGKYVGICAGGYYGCSSIIFAPGTSMEVTGERELRFFPGRCIGPINGNFIQGALGGAIIGQVKSLRTKNVYDMYINGGGYFDNANPLDSNCTIIATIKLNGKEVPIIVWCRYGSGAAILSGAHFEYGPSVLDLEDSSNQARHMITERMREKEESLRKEIEQLICEI